MWRKPTYYKSATFAALVVGSSTALLTGAQAETLNFNSFGGGAQFFSTGTPASGDMSLISVFAGGGSNATFDGLTGGTWSLGTSSTRFSISNLNPATQTWTSIGPNTVPFSSSFGSSGTVMGNVTVTAVQDNPVPNIQAAQGARITLIGDFTETSGTGALGAAFAPGGVFDLRTRITNCSSPCPNTLAAVFAGPPVTFGTAIGLAAAAPRRVDHMRRQLPRNRSFGMPCVIGGLPVTGLPTKGLLT